MASVTLIDLKKIYPRTEKKVKKKKEEGEYQEKPEGQDRHS